MNISAAERSDAMKTYRPTAQLLEDIRMCFRVQPSLLYPFAT